MAYTYHYEAVRH